MHMLNSIIFHLQDLDSLLFMVLPGRPDMAYFGFTNKLKNNEKIRIFNYGNCKRDFTYIDDIVEGVIRVMKKAPDRKTGKDGTTCTAVQSL